MWVTPLWLRVSWRGGVHRASSAVLAVLLRPGRTGSRYFVGYDRGIQRSSEWCAASRSDARLRPPFALLRRSLFIQTEQTPNPKSKKLIPGKPVLEDGTLGFNSREEAKRSPLARGIFRIPGVDGVFLGPDFISVTVREEEIWSEIQGEVFTSIQEFYHDGKPVLDDPSVKPNDVGTAILEGDDSTVCLIKDLIETRIRPTVQQDGGDIAYRGFENGVVKVEMQGSCVGCPSSSATLKQGVQNMLMHYIPEVMGIEDVTNHDQGEAEAKSSDQTEQVVDKASFDKLKDLGF